jgi:hypothetical protein
MSRIVTQTNTKKIISLKINKLKKLLSYISIYFLILLYFLVICAVAGVQKQIRHVYNKRLVWHSLSTTVNSSLNKKKFKIIPT